MKTASIFSSHMVLQRDLPVPIWGWSVADDTITVEFAGQKKTAVTGSDGQWMATLDPVALCAEGRHLVVQSCKENRIERFTDVLVGEVWLASGQSNMEWPVISAKNSGEEMAAANFPGIRLFTVPVRTETNPSPDLRAEWKVCSSNTIPRFSAVAYFFGRKLNRDLGVPVGLVHASKGGTRIEAWTSKNSLQTEPVGELAIAEYESRLNDIHLQSELELYAMSYTDWMCSKVVADPGDSGFSRGWGDPEFDDSAWEEMIVPSKWQNAGHDYCGVFWFRRAVDIPAWQAGNDFVLHLGACDKHDTTYFNNVQIGATGWETPDAWCKERVYHIPGELVRPGKNIIATRVYSYMYDGGLIGPAHLMQLAPCESSGFAPVPLTGPWLYKVEHNLGAQQAPQEPMGAGNPNSPAVLFENMILPLAPLAIRGVIWYQGEANHSAPQDYRKLFPLMIRDWRRTFNQAELPFLFVQIANYMTAQQQPGGESNWAGLREAQSLALREHATGMAVAIDIGDATDIHPLNKQDVGERLALIALAQIHERDVEFSGPLFRSHALEADSLRLCFDHADGLKTIDGSDPKGFAIAGADGKFHWANACIEGETVVLKGGQVSDIESVRYGWSDNPVVSLVNCAGLPASPFRVNLK